MNLSRITVKIIVMNVDSVTRNERKLDGEICFRLIVRRRLCVVSTPQTYPVRRTKHEGFYFDFGS